MKVYAPTGEETFNDVETKREMVSATKYGQIKQDVDKIKAQGEQQLIDEISRLAEEARAQ